MIYEWDPKKAKANLRKHRISFEEALTVFLDPMAVTYPDPDHASEELRNYYWPFSKTESNLYFAHSKKRSHSDHRRTEANVKRAQTI